MYRVKSLRINVSKPIVFLILCSTVLISTSKAYGELGIVGDEVPAVELGMYFELPEGKLPDKNLPPKECRLVVVHNSELNTMRFVWNDGYKLNKNGCDKVGKNNRYILVIKNMGDFYTYSAIFTIWNHKRRVIFNGKSQVVCDPRRGDGADEYQNVSFYCRLRFSAKKFSKNHIFSTLTERANAKELPTRGKLQVYIMKDSGSDLLSMEVIDKDGIVLSKGHHKNINFDLFRA